MDKITELKVKAFDIRAEIEYLQQLYQQVIVELNAELVKANKPTESTTLEN